MLLNNINVFFFYGNFELFNLFFILLQIFYIQDILHNDWIFFYQFKIKSSWILLRICKFNLKYIAYYRNSCILYKVCNYKINFSINLFIILLNLIWIIYLLIVSNASLFTKYTVIRRDKRCVAFYSIIYNYYYYSIYILIN